MQRKGQTERVKVRSYLNFSRIICYTWVGRRRDEPSPRIGIELVINGNSSKVFQPGERALHNTSEWQHGEFLRRLVRTENNGKLRTELLAYGIGQFPSFVSAVRQHLFQSVEAALHLVYNAIRTDIVMGIRLVNHHRKRSAIMPDLKKYLFFLLFHHKTLNLQHWFMHGKNLESRCFLGSPAKFRV